MRSPAWKHSALHKGLPLDWIVSAPVPEEISMKHKIESKEQDRSLYEVIIVYMAPGLPVDGTHVSILTMLLRPIFRGKISIQSANASELPRIEPHYLDTALDRETEKLMLATSSMSAVIENETSPSGENLDGLQLLTADAGDEVIEERIRRTGTQQHHSRGTAAMRKVVDAEGKVMRVKKLHCADASISPHSPGWASFRV